MPTFADFSEEKSTHALLVEVRVLIFERDI